MTYAITIQFFFLIEKEAIHDGQIFGHNFQNDGATPNSDNIPVPTLEMNHNMLLKKRCFSASFWLLVLALVSSTHAFVTPTQPPLAATQKSRTRLHSHLVTECITAGCMAGIGDMLAQQRTNKPWDRQRSLQFILKGLGEGAMWSFWYRTAEKWVTHLTVMALTQGLAPGFERPYRTILSLLLDLVVACPLIYGLWDIPFPALLSGTPLHEIPGRIKSKLGEMLLASVKLWTPVNIVIYNSPMRYRVFLMSSADIFWQSIVSAISTREDGVTTEDDIIKQQANNKQIPAVDFMRVGNYKFAAGEAE